MTNNHRQNRTCSSLGKGVGARGAHGVCFDCPALLAAHQFIHLFVLPAVQQLIHIFSSVCCLLPCASVVVVCLAFDVMLIYVKRVPSAGSCFEGSAPYMYKCRYLYILPPRLLWLMKTRLVTQSQQWAARSGQMCLAFLSLELLLRKYLCLHFAYFMDHHARPADRQSIDICTHIHIYQSKCSILFIGNFVV